LRWHALNQKKTRQQGVFDKNLTSKETIVRLLTYDKKSFEVYERAISRLGWSAATKNREFGHLSFKDTSVHVLNVHQGLLIEVAQARPELRKDDRRWKKNIRSWNDLRLYRDRVWEGLDDLIKGLNEKSSVP
jgi:hypothetical protein